jgi:hypothetical protein
MDLGQSNQRKLVKDKEEFIDPSFFKIQFEINGKVFKKAVDGLLAFETENLDDLTDIDLDKALDQCSYYRFTFLAAGAELESKIAKTLREFNTWYAEAEQIVRKNTIAERLAIKEKEKVPNNWFGSMTKQEIEGRILTDEAYSKTYNQYQDKIEGMKKTMKILFGLRDIIQDRGGHLQSLGKRRLENRKWSFGVKDHVT